MGFAFSSLILPHLNQSLGVPRGQRWSNNTQKNMNSFRMTKPALAAAVGELCEHQH